MNETSNNSQVEIKDKDDVFHIKEIEETLEKYEEESAGLARWQKMDVPPYLYMNLTELRGKSPEELSEAVISLVRYSLNLQRLINKNRAWLRWCEVKSDELTAHFLQDVDQRYGFNERVLIARNNPEICRKLNSFMVKIKMRLERLDQVPYNIKVIADNIRDLKYIALKREKENE